MFYSIMQLYYLQFWREKVAVEQLLVLCCYNRNAIYANE